jgi:peptidyl-prolyl cis-trans isomerase B (cyclophilin B)
MKKLISVLLLLSMALICFASCNKEETPEPTATEEPLVPEGFVAPKFEDIDLSTTESIEGIKISETPTDYVLIDVANYGQILIRLFPDVAPKTVRNFKDLVSKKFYDGIIFHRVIEKFMIQGGDPEGTGYGGSDKKILGEFSLNGFENNLYHRRGVISMARGGSDMNSASSQFFIVHKTNANNTKSLDGKYASFGYVVYGIDVVDDIATTKVSGPANSPKPVKDVVMTSVRFADVSALNFVKE